MACHEPHDSARRVRRGPAASRRPASRRPGRSRAVPAGHVATLFAASACLARSSRSFGASGGRDGPPGGEIDRSRVAMLDERLTERRIRTTSRRRERNAGSPRHVPSIFTDIVAAVGESRLAAAARDRARRCSPWSVIMDFASRTFP